MINNKINLKFALVSLIKINKKKINKKEALVSPIVTKIYFYGYIKKLNRYISKLNKIEIYNKEKYHFYKKSKNSELYRMHIYINNVFELFFKVLESKNFYKIIYNLDRKNNNFIRKPIYYNKAISNKIKFNKFNSSNTIKLNNILFIEDSLYTASRSIIDIDYSLSRARNRIKGFNFIHLDIENKLNNSNFSLTKNISDKLFTSKAIITKENFIELSLVLQSLVAGNKHISDIQKNIIIDYINIDKASKIFYTNLIDSTIATRQDIENKYAKNYNYSTIIPSNNNNIFIKKAKYNYLQKNIYLKNNVYTMLNKFLFYIILDIKILIKKNTYIIVFIKNTDNNIFSKNIDISSFIPPILLLNNINYKNKIKKYYLELLFPKILNNPQIVSLFIFYIKFIKNKKSIKYIYILIIKLFIYVLSKNKKFIK